MFFVGERAVALKSLHGRDPHLRNQVGIFAKGFFHTSPARIARYINDRSQRLMSSPRAGLFSDGGVNFFDKLGIER